MNHLPDRRAFLKASALLGASALITGCRTGRRGSVPRDRKFRLGVIGCGGKGHSDTTACVRAGAEVVALCDVDAERGKGAFEMFPDARRYEDYRDLFDREVDLDGVVIATPDHSHAVPALLAIERGMHVYCQKPLTHTVEEARLLRLAAAEFGVVTQMGNQGTAMDGFREATEVIQSGAIGPVRKVHVWTNRPIWAQGVQRPAEIDAIPSRLRWDLFQGPAPYRPYHSSYAPFSWRGWWDYGTGALGDMACHIMNLAYQALELGAPTRVEVLESNGMTEDSPPTSSVIKYAFPARGSSPPVELYWYDGDLKPPSDVVPGLELAAGGTLIEGDDGVLYSDDDYGARYKLFPEERFEGFEAPSVRLPRVERPVASGAEEGEEPYPRHELIQREWIQACRGEVAASSGFDSAGPFTEAVLLGNVALRAGQTIEWDEARLAVRGSGAAGSFVTKEYARGFELPWKP